MENKTFNFFVTFIMAFTCGGLSSFLVELYVQPAIYPANANSVGVGILVFVIIMLFGWVTYTTK